MIFCSGRAEVATAAIVSRLVLARLHLAHASHALHTTVKFVSILAVILIAIMNIGFFGLLIASNASRHDDDDWADIGYILEAMVIGIALAMFYLSFLVFLSIVLASNASRDPGRKVCR